MKTRVQPESHRKPTDAYVPTAYCLSTFVASCLVVSAYRHFVAISSPQPLVETGHELGVGLTLSCAGPNVGHENCLTSLGGALGANAEPYRLVAN